MRNRMTIRLLGLAGLGLVMASGLSACTTIEGTNAMTDIGTFEREVGVNTLQGLGLVDKPAAKAPITIPRAPLVLPKTDTLPPPQKTSESSLLPKNSDEVEIDTSGLTKADIQRLRNARVFDFRTTTGRPLTAAETKQLEARISKDRLIKANGDRPLYVPPDKYFTTVNGQDLLCLAANGDLVPLDDPACPPDIKAALQEQQKKTK